MKKAVIKIIVIIIFFGGAYQLINKKGSYSNKAERAKPNFIVIMADDLGYGDVGFNGSTEIPTPNIDRIAANGIKFTNGYTSYSVCSPSRAGFITGRYQQRFGYERNIQYRPNDPNMGLPQTEKTIPEILGQVGYKSRIIGKWHLGAHISNHPMNRGFTSFFGHLGGGHKYFPEELTIKDSYSFSDEPMSYKTWIMKDHTPVEIKNYLTDEFSDNAVSFIDKTQKDPFFLFVSYNAPHSPLQATEKYLSRFEHIEDPKRRTYAAMVSAVDDGVGKILDQLEAKGLNEKTLVFFLSDNGGPEHANSSDNGLLREGKGSIYEGGNRIPFAMQWPGELSPMVYDYPVSALDLMATFADLADAPLAKDRPLDGVNIIPYIQGKKNGSPHSTLYIRKFDGDFYSVRDGDLKLVTKENNSVKELYNLSEDISEENDIAELYPQELIRLDSLRQKWDAELIDPIFLGLMHTERYIQKRLNNKKRK